MNTSKLARACADSSPPRQSSSPRQSPVLRLALVVILGLAMATVSVAVGAPRSNASGSTVVITGSLSPKSLSITPGTEVTWINSDVVDHRMRAQDGDIHFDSHRLEPGEQWSHTFRKAGTATYHDDGNPANTAYDGTVVVGQQGPGGGTPPMPPMPPMPPPPGAPVPPAPPAPPAPALANVTIGGNFLPATVTISTGGTVTWTNHDSSAHTATANDGSFDSGPIKYGATWSHIFSTPGTFAYVCSFHSGMKGTVTVVNRPGAPVPPPPPAPAPHQPPPAPAPPAPAPPAPPTGSTAVTHQVAVTDAGFSPAILNARVGDTVTWVNSGKMPHTMTGGPWDAPLAVGQSFSAVLSATGTISYVCSYHSYMKGTVNVSAALPGTKLPPPAPKGGSKPPVPPGAPTPHHPPAGSKVPAPPAGSKAASHQVSVTDAGFSPAILNARVGDTVTWVNSGKMPHTMTGGPWDAPLAVGQSFSTVLRAPGTISYVCSYHAYMKGTVNVSAAPAGTKLPPPSAGGSGSGTTGAHSAPAAPAGPPPVVAPGAQRHTVTMSGSTFSPQTLVARVGDSVTWVNKDPMPHSVTGGGWDSMVMPGGQFSTVLRAPGTVSYVCSMHPGMTGTLQITAAAPGTKLPAAVPVAPQAHGTTHAAQPAPVPAASAAKLLVTIKDFTFSPATLAAKVGDTVTFVNQDSAAHTATAKDKSFDSGMLMKGQKFTVKLTKVGTIEVLCTYHPNMVGKIVVSAANAPAAPAAPAQQNTKTTAIASVLTAGNVAGFGSGWIGLLVFLAGTQLRTRFTTRR